MSPNCRLTLTSQSIYSASIDSVGNISIGGYIMFIKNHSVRKYIVSTAFVTTIALTPIFSGSVFAHADPDAETSKNNAPVNTPVTEQVEKEETSTSKTGIVSMNDRGETVRNIQEVLNNQGYTANPDGIFGKETDKAVRDFQNDKNLSVDGLVGPETKDSLSISSTNDDEDLTITEDRKSTRLNSSHVANTYAVFCLQKE